MTCSFVIEKLKPLKKYSPGQVLLTLQKKKQGGILIRKFWLLKVYLHTTLIKFFFPKRDSDFIKKYLMHKNVDIRNLLKGAILPNDRNVRSLWKSNYFEILDCSDFL